MFAMRNDTKKIICMLVNLIDKKKIQTNRDLLIKNCACVFFFPK